MEIVQVYETTVADRERGFTVQFIVVPARSIANSSFLENPSDLMDFLGLRLLQQIPSPDFLPDAIASMLVENDADAASERLRNLIAAREGHIVAREGHIVVLQEGTTMLVEGSTLEESIKKESDTSEKIEELGERIEEGYANIDSEVRTFAEYVTLEKLVPFEESPLEAQSFANIATTASPWVVGAVVGFIAAGPTAPLLLVTVPAGIILCQAAKAAAEGLEYQIRRLMGVPAIPLDKEQTELEH
jgi:hypothetical protein